MRLGQLGRKLSLRPAEIVEFLASNDIQVGSGSNTRIEDEHALLVIRHFAPGQENLLKEEKEEEISAPISPNEPAINFEPEVIEEAKEVKEIKTAVLEETQIENIQIKVEDSAPIQQPVNSDEVIKAPKVELPGLKVLGKIELPELKKKEPEVLGEAPVEDISNTEKTPVVEQPKKTQREDRRPAYQKRDRNEFRPRKNPIALQREQEALEAERRRKEQIEFEKERRTQNYLKKVKTVQPTKAAKLIKEQVIEMSSLEEDKPKSWWGRVIHWLTKAH